MPEARRHGRRRRVGGVDLRADHGPATPPSLPDLWDTRLMSPRGTPTRSSSATARSASEKLSKRRVTTWLMAHPFAGCAGFKKCEVLTALVGV